MNHKLYELYPNMKIVKHAKIQWMRWPEQVDRVKNTAPVKKRIADQDQITLSVLSMHLVIKSYHTGTKYRKPF